MGRGALVQSKGGGGLLSYIGGGFGRGGGLLPSPGRPGGAFVKGGLLSGGLMSYTPGV